jgi:L-histidine Nalpha-methyltransferase
MKFSRQHIFDETILGAVDEGLSASPKRLPSWLFYDAQGNKIFQEIMHMPEYYATRCEYEILQDYKEALLNYFTYDQEQFQLMELGAGDGIKTEILLEYFISQGVHFNYVPVDVSAEILAQLTHRLQVRLPELDLAPQNQTYEQAIACLRNNVRKVILFLGANIGNYGIHEAGEFLSKMASGMNHGDLLLIGFDMKKDPRVIQLAYDDPKGITRAFNLNMLRRINKEMGGHFNIDRFLHYPLYDPVSGEAKSYLISSVKQEVYIEALHKTFSFSRWEPIYTEVSQKYDIGMIQDMISKAGLQIAEVFYDSKKYFCDVLIRK